MRLLTRTLAIAISVFLLTMTSVVSAEECGKIVYLYDNSDGGNSDNPGTDPGPPTSEYLTYRKIIWD